MVFPFCRIGIPVIFLFFFLSINFSIFSELFELFDVNPSLWCQAGVAQAVLATYTWCFMQFTLVFTATTRTVPDEAKKKV